MAPANADAYRASAHARYVVYEEIEDAWREVSEGGRPVDPPELPSGRLESFTAGPDPGSSPRFGSTTYVRHPEQPNLWTMATGELKSFWVSASDVEPVSEEAVTGHLRQ